MLRLTKTISRPTSQITYEGFLTSNDSSATPQTLYTKFADLSLTGDPDIVRDENAFHRLAENGLNRSGGSRRERGHAPSARQKRCYSPRFRLPPSS